MAHPLRIQAGRDSLGPRQILSPSGEEALALARQVRDGLPVDAVDRLVADRRLTAAEVDRVLLPRRTLDHRRKAGRLTPDQSDRLLRVARVLALAEETFGDDVLAGEWLRRPTTALGGEAPLDMLDTEVGAQQVTILLGRIAHGIAA